MLYLCISFDYELFLGKNYVSEDDILIKPTDKLNKMLTEEGISACFFADVCCPAQYRKSGQNHFPDLFDKQLKELVQNGHDVQLHIHPNWLKCSSIGSSIEFERKYFRLHNWKNESPDAISEIVHSGIEYLYKTLTPVSPSYRCVAYRAGGYCLQPENELSDILYNEGIRIDSSVCPGMHYSGDGMHYDYRDVPLKNIYFNRHHTLTDEHTSPLPDGILEVPVGSYHTFPYRLVASKLNKGYHDIAPIGESMSISRKPIDKSFSARIKNLAKSSNMLTFDSYTAESMIYMLNRISKECKSSKSDLFISTISHPKLLSDKHIENMRTVLRAMKKNKNVKFVNMQDIANIKNL